MTIALHRRHILAAGLAALLPLPVRAGEAEPIRVPFRLYRDSSLVADVRLDDKGPYPFVLATGASLNVIDWDLAHELGLPRVNQMKNFLLQGKSVSTGSVDKETDFEVKSVRIGARDMGRRVFDSSPPKPDEQAWHDRHMTAPDYPRGIVGTAFFLETPCVVDREGGEVRFYPGGIPGLDAFAAIPTHIRDMDLAHDKSIEVDASLGGADLRCWIDLNGEAGLYLSSKYVRKHHLYDRFKDYIEAPSNTAAPERGGYRSVRMKDFRIGAVHFDEINVQLADPDHDDHLDDAGVKAVIGGGLLQQMTVAFQDNTVFLKPNSRFRPVSEPYTPPSPGD